ncbi:MAG: hypothetical protein Q4A84_08805 [Neisseria sp.]|uniref:hypothetical protein n=1 Tax=Neisseria sp. TaxID=192066 RepID=UPI0026DA7A88|nr:hypothetical protein [Neisseria sp.]MDO4641775.1 hypothetical protein [Neisseria sp.]
MPTNSRVIYEGGQAVGKGSVREYSEWVGTPTRLLSSGTSYGTRIEVGTVYPDSYFYDDSRYPSGWRGDYFQWQNRMRLREHRLEAQHLSPNTNNKLYNEVVTKQRLKERQQQGLDNRERPYPPPPPPPRPIPDRNRM